MAQRAPPGAHHPTEGAQRLVGVSCQREPFRKLGQWTTATATYQLLDGKRCGEALNADIAAKAAEVKAERGRAPHLAAVLVGNDGASKTYVESKVKACESVGFRSTLIRLPETITRGGVAPPGEA